MSPGLLAALAAALAYGSGTVLQAQAVEQVGADGGLLRRLVRQRRYLAGLALDLVGFTAGALALQTEPLFLVQAVLAASIGVTALLARAVLGAVLDRRDTAALVVLGAGLLLMAASARTGPAVHGGALAGLVLLAGALALALMTARTTSGPLLAVVAGLAAGGAGIAARALAIPHPLWHLTGQPIALAVAGYGAVCAWAFAEALRQSSATVVTATCFAVSTVLPAVVGVALLGDRTRSGWGGAAVVGVVVVLVATALLAARTPTPAAQPV